MSTRYAELNNAHKTFIGRQHIFFVGTAAQEGFVNVSPKGMDSFRVINNSKIVWLNLTGSGNESAAHILENDRMTVMFCSFEKRPLILRLYGHARVIHPRNEHWSERIALFPDFIGARQIFELHLEMVQTSCGYAVPYYELTSERPTLDQWADKRGKQGIEKYWEDRNTKSLDNKDTGILNDVEPSNPPGE